jgi:hypothetical protein
MRYKAVELPLIVQDVISSKNDGLEAEIIKGKEIKETVE